jgi:hypothetical protein
VVASLLAGQRVVDSEHTKLLYEENAKVAAVFWDWRHKVMTFGFAVMSGLVVVTGWLVKHHLSRSLVALPLGIGALLAFGAAALDLRVGQILRMTFTTGSQLEAHIGHAGFFRSMQPSRPIMSKVLPVIYGAVGLAFAALSLYELVGNKPLR